MRAAAVKPDDDSWKVAKANLVALNQAMVQSPDLTSEQVDKLYAAYKTELLKQRERALDLGALGPEEESEAEQKIRAAATTWTYHSGAANGGCGSASHAPAASHNAAGPQTYRSAFLLTSSPWTHVLSLLPQPIVKRCKKIDATLTVISMR